MNSDEVVDYIINNLKNLDENNRKTLLFKISCLNHDIDCHDKDAIWDGCDILALLGVLKMEVEDYGAEIYNLVDYDNDDDSE